MGTRTHFNFEKECAAPWSAGAGPGFSVRAADHPPRVMLPPAGQCSLPATMIAPELSVLVEGNPQCEPERPSARHRCRPPSA